MNRVSNINAHYKKTTQGQLKIENTSKKTYK